MKRVQFWFSIGIFFCASYVGLSSQLTLLWPDVEQGACLLVVGPDVGGSRIAVLIDAGTGYGTVPEVKPTDTIRELLARDPRALLKYLVITHDHVDHYSWLAEIRAAGLLCSDAVEYTRANAQPGQVIDLGDGATVRFVIADGVVLQEGNRVRITSSYEENDRSCGLLISYKAFHAWVGGDLSSAVETKLAQFIGDVDLYVMHHHGSKYSSSRDFLDVLKPEVSICQTGDGNPYGHPTAEAIRRVLATVHSASGTPLVILQNRGSYNLTLPNVYIADPDGPGGRPGTIMLTTDGFSYAIEAPGLPSPLSLLADELASVPSAEASPSAATIEEESVAPVTYRLSLLSNQMPVYHAREPWILIVYPEGLTDATILAARGPLSQALIFEKELKPRAVVHLWIAAIDPEAWPDVGQIRYTLQLPPLEKGGSLTFTVEFTVFGDSGGPASLTFKLERL